MRKTPESIEGSTGRISTYPNAILFTATLLPFSSRSSSVSTYLKALYLPLLPFSPFYHPILLFRRESFLTTRIPSFPPPSRRLRVPSTLPPPSGPVPCAPSPPLTTALALSSSLSLARPLPSADLQTRKTDKEALLERRGTREGTREGERWGWLSLVLRDAYQSTQSHGRATATVPVKGIERGRDFPQVPRGISRSLPAPLPREHRALQPCPFRSDPRSEPRAFSNTAV